MGMPMQIYGLMLLLRKGLRRAPAHPQREQTPSIPLRRFSCISKQSEKWNDKA